MLNAWQGERLRFRDTNEASRRIKSNVPLIQAMQDVGIKIPNSSANTVKIRCFDHEDDTPSLTVSANKNLFNCFGAGCEIGGDVISFTMQFHKIEFIDAICYLVENYTIDVHDLLVEKTKEEKTLERYMDINHEAAKFIYASSKKNGVLVRFFKAKGISDEVRCRMLVGLSLDARKLCSHLRSQGTSKEDLQVLQLDRDDLFGNRIIYPIFNAQGKVLSFYGRATNNVDVKYLGTSRSNRNGVAHPLLDTSIPYGLHVARKNISKNNGHIVLVEGHNDVLGLYSHEILNVAGIMTSTPSEAQYATLDKIHIKNIIICPDGDLAGKRTITDINKHRSRHQKVKLAIMPDNVDPDDFVHEHGGEEFKNILSNAIYPVEIVIRDLADKYARNGMTKRIDAIEDAIRGLTNLNPIEREFAIFEISTITGIDKDAIEVAASDVEDAPTSDVQLEQKIIGECCNDKTKAMYAVQELAPEDFVGIKHYSIWKTLISMVANDITPFTREMLITYAIDKELLKEKDADMVPKIRLGSQGLEYAIDKIKDLSMRRNLYKSANRLLSDIRSKRTDVKQAMNQHMVNIATSTSSKLDVSVASTHIKSAMDTIHERMENPGIPGIHIGKNWKKFMHSILGFRKGHMHTIAGVTKAGKTTIAQNWNLEQLINCGHPTLWINLEMSEEDLVMRNLSIMSGVDNQRLRIGNISKEEKDVIDKCAAAYHGFKLYTANMAGATSFDVINCIRRFVYAHGIRIVFVDYIQLVRFAGASRGKALWEDQNEVVSALRDAISKLGITGILISQLNRGALIDNSSSGQHVSGTIKLIQDSDSFMGIRKKTKTELEASPHSNSSLQIEFNRHGPQGLEIDLNFRYQSGRIREI